MWSGGWLNIYPYISYKVTSLNWSKDLLRVAGSEGIQEVRLNPTPPAVFKNPLKKIKYPMKMK